MRVNKWCAIIREKALWNAKLANDIILDEAGYDSSTSSYKSYYIVGPNSVRVYLPSPQKNLVLKVDTTRFQSWTDPGLRLRYQDTHDSLGTSEILET